MNWVIAKMKWLMLVSGVLTSTMLYAAICAASRATLHVRRIAAGSGCRDCRTQLGRTDRLVGAMLIYGAFNPPARPLILTVAGLSKLIFIGLVLAHGSRYLGQQADLAISIDLVMVVLFIAYLVGVRRGQTAA